MKLSLVFDVNSEGIPATHLARLLLDLQHLCLMMIAVSNLENRKANDIAFLEKVWKYAGMLEVKEDELGTAKAIVISIHKSSPLSIDILLNLPKAGAKLVADNFRFLYEHFLFIDLEREKRKLELEMLQQELIREKLANLETAFRVAAKIKDAKMRQQFLQGLYYSIEPFMDGRHQLLRMEIKED